MSILNLTQHFATKEQLEEGVVEPINKSLVQDLLTFNNLPTGSEIQCRAQALANLCKKEGFKTAMIGGAPFLMEALSNHLKLRNIKPVYSFSIRTSYDTVQDDGSIRKYSEFTHKGFVTY